MSSRTVFFALVVGYVGIVLAYAAFGDSLEGLAGLRARLRHRARRRHLVGALAGAAVVGLAALAVVGMRDGGTRANVGRESALGPQPADPAPRHPSRALVPRVAATHAAPVTGQRRPARVRERHTKVVSDLVNVSASVVAPASTTVSTQAARSDGPAPLRAPAESGAPSPLAAP